MRNRYYATFGIDVCLGGSLVLEDDDLANIALALKESDRTQHKHLCIDYFEQCLDKLPLCKKDTEADNPMGREHNAMILFLEAKLKYLLRTHDHKITYHDSDDLILAEGQWGHYKLESVLLEATYRRRNDEPSKAKESYDRVIQIIMDARILSNDVMPTTTSQKNINKMAHSRFLLEAHLGVLELLPSAQEKKEYIVRLLDNESLPYLLCAELVSQLIRLNFIREAEEKIAVILQHLQIIDPTLNQQLLEKFADLMVEKNNRSAAVCYYNEVLLCSDKTGQSALETTLKLMKLELLSKDNLLRQHYFLSFNKKWTFTVDNFIMLADLYHLMGRYDEALKAYDAALRLFLESSSSFIPKPPPWQSQESLNKEILESFDAKMNLLLMNIFIQLSNNKCGRTKAKPYDDFIIEFKGHSVPLLYEVGRFYASIAGDSDIVEIFFKKILIIDPNHTMALHEMIKIFLLTNKQQEAVSLYKRLIQLDPLNPEYDYTGGELLFKTGQFEEAYDLLLKAQQHERDPGRQYWINVFLSRCVIAWDNDGESAEAYFKQALDLCPPSDRSTLYYDQACVYKHYKPLANQAIHFFLEVLEMSKENLSVIKIKDLLNKNKVDHSKMMLTLFSLAELLISIEDTASAKIVLTAISDESSPFHRASSDRLRATIAFGNRNYYEVMHHLKASFNSLSVCKFIEKEVFNALFEQCHLLWAETLFIQRKYGEAASYITKHMPSFLHSSLKRPFLMIKLNALLFECQYEQCETIFSNVSELDWDDEMRCIQVQAYLAQAEKLFQKGEVVVSQTKMQSCFLIRQRIHLVSSKTHYIDALLVNSPCSTETDKNRTAIEHLTLAINTTPVHAAAHQMIAGLYLENGSYLNAVSHFEKSIGLGLDEWDAPLHIGIALSKLGRRSAEAIEHYQSALKRAPKKRDVVRIYTLIGHEHLARSHYKQAESAFESALQTAKLLDKNEVKTRLYFVDAVVGLATVKYRQSQGKQVNEAMTMLQALHIDLTQVDSDDYFECIILNATILYDQKKPMEALRLVQRVVHSSKFSHGDRALMSNIEKLGVHSAVYDKMESAFQAGEYQAVIECITTNNSPLSDCPYYIVELLANAYWACVKDHVDDEPMLRKAHAVTDHMLQQYSESGSKTALFIKAELFFFGRDYENALVYYKKLNQHKHHYFKREGGSLHQRIAQSAYACSDVKEAYFHYKAAFELNSLDDEHTLILAKLASDLKRPPNQLCTYYAAITEDYLQQDCQHYIRALYQSGQYNNAYLYITQHLDKILSFQLSPSDYALFAMIYLKTMEHEQAIINFEKSASLEADEELFSRDDLFLLGKLYYEKSDIPRAKDCFERALRSNDPSRVLRSYAILLCKTYLYLNESVKAVQYFETIKAPSRHDAMTEVDFSAEEYLHLATLYLEIKNYQKCLCLLNRYSTYYDQNYRSLAITATVHFEQNNNGMALKFFESARQYATDYEPSHARDLAYTYLYSKQYSKAIDHALIAANLYRSCQMESHDLTYILCAAHYCLQENDKSLDYLLQWLGTSLLEERFYDAFIMILSASMNNCSASVKSKGLACYINISMQAPSVAMKIAEGLLLMNPKDPFAYILKSRVETTPIGSLAILAGALKVVYSVEVSVALFLPECSAIQTDLIQLLTLFIMLKEGFENESHQPPWSELASVNPCFIKEYETLNAILKAKCPSVPSFVTANQHPIVFFERFAQAIWTKEILKRYIRELSDEFSPLHQDNAARSELSRTLHITFVRSIYLLSQKVFEQQLRDRESTQLIHDFFRQWQALTLYRLCCFTPLSFSLTLHVIVKLNLKCEDYFLSQFLNAAADKLNEFDSNNLYYFLLNFIQIKCSTRSTLSVMLQWKQSAVVLCDRFSDKQRAKFTEIFLSGCELPEVLLLPSRFDPPTYDDTVVHGLLVANGFFSGQERSGDLSMDVPFPP